MADVIEQLFGRIVFATGKTEYPWEDVILASALGPDWQEVVEKARLGAALVTESEESEDSPISDEDVEAAANEFRYDRDLLTADEVEVWLTRWGLEVDTWMNWIVADLLRKSADEESLKSAAAVGIDPDDLAAAVHAEAVLSGALARLAYRLAGRVSISDKLWEQGPGEADEPEPQIPASVDAEALVPNLPPGEARLRLVSLARREAAFQRATASAVTPASIEARVRSNQSDWMRVTTRSIELPGEDMAREAMRRQSSKIPLRCRMIKRSADA